MRLSEVYASIQGEGPRVGVPTVFVRFAGCNLKCPGWPCDTQHAIDPAKYRHEWKKVTPFELFDQVMEVMTKYDIDNVCLTGGEPYLQVHDELKELIRLLRNARSCNVEVFTNGSLTWPVWSGWTVQTIMDFKLAGSGEWLDRCPIWENVKTLGHGDAIKFTVAHVGDLREARGIWEEWLRRQLPPVEFYAGPVWGLMKEGDVAQFILDHKLPWKLNVQLHKYIWDPEARGT